MNGLKVLGRTTLKNLPDDAGVYSLTVFEPTQPYSAGVRQWFGLSGKVSSACFLPQFRRVFAG
jgi:hypothetical protein